MFLSVPSQRTRIAVRLVASLEITRVRFILPVSQHVSVQVVMPLESFAALRADKLALVAMSDHVLRQGTLVGELFAALVADEGPLLGPLSAASMCHHGSVFCGCRYCCRSRRRCAIALKGIGAIGET